jgi:hypothetical protein
LKKNPTVVCRRRPPPSSSVRRHHLLPLSSAAAAVVAEEKSNCPPPLLSTTVVCRRCHLTYSLKVFQAWLGWKMAVMMVVSSFIHHTMAGKSPSALRTRFGRSSLNDILRQV